MEYSSIEMLAWILPCRVLFHLISSHLVSSYPIPNLIFQTQMRKKKERENFSFYEMRSAMYALMRKRKRKKSISSTYRPTTLLLINLLHQNPNPHLRNPLPTPPDLIAKLQLKNNHTRFSLSLPSHPSIPKPTPPQISNLRTDAAFPERLGGDMFCVPVAELVRVVED